GGSSVGTLDRIHAIADRLGRDARAGKKIVAVVSAMAGETDRLLALGRHFTPQPPARELDFLVSTGEQISAGLLAIALRSKGIPSLALLGHQVPIRTDRNFGEAQIEFVAPHRVKDRLNSGEVVVIAGFQGVTEEGEITTLGRGGSDLTAVALAVALEASVCRIFTDVPGVFTADPQICADARPIRKISYDEMLELASLGAKVLQSRSVQLAKRYQIPLQVLSSFDDGEGTWVQKEDRDMEKTVVSGITCDRKEGKISVRHLPDPVHAAEKLFSGLAEAQIVVDVIVQDRGSDGKTNITFTVPRESFDKAAAIAQKLAKSDSKTEILLQDRIAKISAVGLGMRSHSGVAAQMFQTLAKEGIDVAAVSTSDIKISCVIDDRYAELAVRALHDAFGLAKEVN
ncbi:MAG TPA: aspartate kinase, partial [Bdellovibrionota bacterium]|nr:aspartate kinase [Bdellovibrionota bacterium]